MLDKIIGVDKIIAVDKISASIKYWHQQNTGVDKILASSKSWHRQKAGAGKKLAQTKRWRRRRRIPLLFGSAESTAADFSPGPAEDLLRLPDVLLFLHAVIKCGVASSCPAFMGGLSPVLDRLIVTARHAKNVKNISGDKISVSA